MTARAVGFRRIGPAAVVRALAILALAHPASASEPGLQLRLAPAQVKQGEIVRLTLTGPAPLRELTLRMADRPLLLPPAWGAPEAAIWIGVDLEQPPGPVPIAAEARGAGGGRLAGQVTLLVVDGRFAMQRLTVAKAFTELDPATLERVAREQAALDRLWALASPERHWRGPFHAPLEGAGAGAGFGLRRVINGEPRAPHTGADLPAPAGTPVRAANAGVVALADEHFFAGKSLVLDHGWGLYTMYFHLQEFLVRPGDRVPRGAAVARVGQTGRVTGPHLHWGARLYGARIDPEQLLRLPQLE
jgi:murein DD-endopeptidase MepM/ murein hydrolase activator NlpD